MTKSRALLYFCSAFIIGVFLDSVIELPRLFLTGVLVFGLLSLLFFTKDKKLAVFGLCFMFLLLGAWRHQQAVKEINGSELKKYNDREETVILEGMVVKEPLIKYERLKITVRVDKIGDKIFEKKTPGEILVTLDRYPEYQYGDKVRIKGKLKTPPIFEDFNYQNYLAKDGIYSVIYWPKITVIGKDAGSPLTKLLFYVKSELERSLNQLMAPPQSALLEALFFGKEENISSDWQNKFNLTGTRHITAVSGMNITIISFLLLDFLLLIGFFRNQAFYFVVISIFFYILMIGAPASAVRAGIMAGLFFTAQHLGRSSAAGRAILLAITIMLIQNPLLLKWDIGFQLSCLAMAGLIYLQPFFLGLFKKAPAGFQFKNTLSATMAAQAFTLPILVYNFGRVPILSPLVNILIVPLLPAITAWGFFFSFIGLFWEALARIISWPVWLLSTYLLGVIDFFSRIPLVSFTVVNVSWFWLVISYSLLGYFIYWLEQKRKLRFLDY